MNFRRIAAVALLGSSALAACGAPEQKDALPVQGAPEVAVTAPSTQAKLDPCSYISAEEVAAITTSTVKRATATGHSCTYHSDPDDGAETTIYLGDGVKQMEVVRKSIALLSGVGKQVSDQGAVGADAGALLRAENGETPELGNETLWNSVLTLSVLQGDNMVEVTPPLMHDPATHAGIPLIPRAERREMALQIAAKILTRIDEQPR